jgi:hypothetical protein
MLLRDHPLMSYHGVPSWPPVWTCKNGLQKKLRRGEIGILKSVTISNSQPADRCFLYIEHEGSSYVGCLLFDDSTFCGQIAKVLQGYCNRRIAEIGSLDLSPTL